MNIAFVIGVLATPDATYEIPWKDHMEGVGHTVTYKDDDDNTWSPASYDLVATSVRVTDTKVAWLYSATVGLINMKHAATDELKFATNYQSLGSTDINITDNSHYITSPFATGLLTVYSPSKYSTGIYNYGPGFSSLAYRPENSAQKILGIYNTGDEMIDSYIAPARRVHMGLYSVLDLTSDGWTLQARAVIWAGTLPTNPYPTELINRKVISGFHCFLGTYIKAKIAGYDPLKLPDGTIF